MKPLVLYEEKFPGHAEGSWWRVTVEHPCGHNPCQQKYDDCPVLKVDVCRPGRSYQSVLRFAKPRKDIIDNMAQNLQKAIKVLGATS